MTLSFDELFEEEIEENGPSQYDSHDLVDEEDKMILMHRDAHFSGSFDWMLKYYYDQGVGIDPNISVQRIEELKLIEESQKSNLAPTLLAGPEAERISQAKEAYKNLKEICENSKEDAPAYLLASLILSEEEDPKEEIEALVALGSEVVAMLVQALNSETFLDPLGPGYGLAPRRILKTLSFIQDPSVSKELFALLNRNLYEDEEIILECLRNIGEKAYQFLIEVLNSQPLSEDNTKAAYALISFQNEVCARACLELLENHLEKEPMPQMLTSYAILACESLSDEDKARFLKLKDVVPEKLLSDYELIANSFS